MAAVLRLTFFKTYQQISQQTSYRFIFTTPYKSNLKSSEEKKKYNGFALGNRIPRVGVYMATMAFAMLAISYAAVPLYRIYCQVTGKGGKAVRENEDKILSMKKNEDRLITVIFNADTSSKMAWRFEPVQSKVKVHPGETTLAFYRARNPLDKPVIGVATYSVMPYEAGLYFNKIQCFCFEEQMLDANEDVFMPVLFYIDPKFIEDPRLETTDEIILSYTFFQSKDGGLFMPKIGTDSDGGLLNLQ